MFRPLQLLCKKEQITTLMKSENRFRWSGTKILRLRNNKHGFEIVLIVITFIPNVIKSSVVITGNTQTGCYRGYSCGATLRCWRRLPWEHLLNSYWLVASQCYSRCTVFVTVEAFRADSYVCLYPAGHSCVRRLISRVIWRRAPSA